LTPIEGRVVLIPSKEGVLKMNGLTLTNITYKKELYISLSQEFKFRNPNHYTENPN
jgi:hypothetical protein